MDEMKLKEVAEESAELAVMARTTITTQDEYNGAAEALKHAKAVLKKLDGIFDPLIKSANEAVKAIRAEKAKHAEPIERAEQVLRQATAAYITEQERQKAIEEDRRRKEAAAEEQRRKEAADAESDFLAEIGLEETVLPEAVVVAPVAAVDQAGISFREVWKFRVTDIAQVPKEYLMLNEAKIGQVVRAMKALTHIPGIEAYAEKTAVVR
jgi:hypothetical protein